MSAIAQALTDKDFLSGNPDDQKAYLSHIDSDFASGSPNDQNAYLNHILAPHRLEKSAQPTQFEKDRTPDANAGGFWGGVKSALGGNEPEPTFGDTVKKGFEAGIPGLGIAKTLYGAAKNAPENYRTGVKTANETSEGGQAPADVRGFVGATHAAAPLFGIDPQSMRARAERGDTAGIAGEAAVPIGTAIAPLAGEGLMRAGGMARKGIRNAAYENAEPKPIVKSIGNALEHPTTIPGKVIGATAKRVFGPPAEQVKARAGEANAADLGQRMTEVEKARQKELADNARMSREEEKQHRQFANTIEDTESARQKELAANERLKTMHGNDLMRRGAEQEGLDAESIGAKIVDPTAQEPRFTGSEGRAATWRNERVEQLAKQGVRPAIEQQIRRGEELPPNVRYVMGDADYPRAVYNPRETTIFGPDGRAIRDVADPTVRAPRERIAQPPQESIGEPIGVNEQAESARKVLSDPAATPEAKANAAEIIRRLRGYR